MNPFAISGLLVFMTNASLGVFVLIKSFRNRTNRLWAYFTFVVAGWGFGAFKIGTVHDPQTALWYWKLTHISIVLIPIVFFHFLCRFLDIKNKTLILFSYIIFALLLISIFTNHLINHVTFVFNSFYFHSRPPTFLYKIMLTLWFTLIIYSNFLLYNGMQSASDTKRNQIKYFFLATILGSSGGLTNFFPALGIDIYPWGNFSVAIYPIIMTYAIFKYNLMDVNIVIRRSLIYSLLVTAITLIFLITVLISENLFHHMVHYQNLTTSILIASLIALVFTPLKNRIQNLVDRAFFKATPMEIANQNEKLKAVATLASGLAHEIKNPLTTLKTFSEFVPQKKNDPEFMAQYQKIIPQEIDRIDNLVHELLLFAKPSPPQMQSVNPNEIINNIALMLKQKFDSAKIDIQMRLNANTPIQADPNQLKQALLNLILNALEAMPNGGTLTIITSLSFPNASVGNPEHFIIEISDTGCGIAPKDLPHIFEPFFTKKEKGTGLGLAITQGIIEKHSGKLSVKSQIDQGTTFNIILPINHAF